MSNVGSIFAAKLIFQDGNYRTTALNLALALILQKNKGLHNEKGEDIIISENVSADGSCCTIHLTRY